MWTVSGGAKAANVFALFFASVFTETPLAVARSQGGMRSTRETFVRTVARNQAGQLPDY
jgi:hypothetical protein